jgi:hypothetical protein
MKDLWNIIFIVLQLISIGILTYFLYTQFGVSTEEARHVSSLIRIGTESFFVDSETGNVTFVANK